MPLPRLRTSQVGALLIAAMCAAATPAATEQTAAPASPGLATIVSAVAAAEDGPGRRAALVAALAGHRLRIDQQPFAGPQSQQGVNLEVSIPGSGERSLVIGAHYDRVQAGRGIIDNGAGCAVLVEMLASLRDRPLQHLNVVGVFFDLEELGLVGSRAWLTARTERSRPRPDFAINVDVFGYGDTIYATSSIPDGRLAGALREATAARRVPLRSSPTSQYPMSDHATFIQNGIETVGVALVDAADVDAIQAALTPGGPQPATRPRIFTLLHSAADTEGAARLPDVEKGRDTLEAFLRGFDASLGGTQTASRP